MPNISHPRLAAHLDRCWALYRDGLIADIAAQLPQGWELFRGIADELDSCSRGNAELELSMLAVITRMVTAEEHVDTIVKASTALTDRAVATDCAADGLHRMGAFAVGVHAAMRVAQMEMADQRFRHVLAAAQGLASEGGESGVTMDDVCAVLGCAGLHLAGTAAARGDAEMALSLLEHSTMTAAELGREHDILGQYFGPQHVLASRSICLGTVRRFEESLEVGRTVNTAVLMPLVGLTLMRTMAEACEQLEQQGAAQVLRQRADAIAPPLRRQFGLDRGPES